jgi:hypothetical protein
MTTFQIKLSSEDRLVAPRQETLEDLATTVDTEQIVGGSTGAPNESVDRREKT